MSAVKVSSTKRQVYYCPRRERNWVNEHTDKIKDCKNSGYIKEDITDELVWNTVIDVITKSNQFREEIKLQVLGEKVTYRDSKKQLEKLLKDVKRLNNDINEYKEVKKISLGQIESLKKLGIEQDIENQKKTIKHIEQAITETEYKKQSVLNEVNKLESSIDWVDWLSEYKNKLKNLHQLNDDEKHKILSKIIDTIFVKKIDKKTTELRITFKLPYVDDELIWNDNNDKSKGYIIKNGKNERKVVVTDEKKFKRNQ